MATYHYRQTRRQKTVLLVILGVILLSLAVFTVWYFFIRADIKEPTEQNDSPAIVAQTEKPSASTEATVNSGPEPTTTEDPKKQTQNEGSDPNKSKILTGAITRADVTNDKLTIRVNIDQYLSGGSCELVLENGAKTYRETANITDAASTSTCEGFDIPTSKLAAGTWTINIKLNSGEKEGTISGKATV